MARQARNEVDQTRKSPIGCDWQARYDMEPRGRVRTGLAGEEARGAEWYEPEGQGRRGMARFITERRGAEG